MSDSSGRNVRSARTKRRGQECPRHASKNAGQEFPTQTNQNLAGEGARATQARMSDRNVRPTPDKKTRARVPAPHEQNNTVTGNLRQECPTHKIRTQGTSGVFKRLFLLAITSAAIFLRIVEVRHRLNTD